MSLDPGPDSSALIVWNGSIVIKNMFAPNESILSLLRSTDARVKQVVPLIIEKVTSYGMAVGETTFDTVYFTGRFAEAYGENVFRVPRMEVKMHLCHDSRAKDTNIRQALLDRFGKPGTKQKPSTLYGVSKHGWAALALAVTWHDQHGAESAERMVVNEQSRTH